MKKSNLTPWQSGTSGNPRGRPKGSRNIKKVIQDLLDDPATVRKLALRLPQDSETPLEAIVFTLMVKAIRGDARSAEVLLKYSVDKDMPPLEGGFFSQNELRIVVVDAKGNPQTDSAIVDDAAGMLIG